MKLRNLNACSNLHHMYKNGQGVKQDLKRAQEYKDLVEAVLKQKRDLPPKPVAN